MSLLGQVYKDLRRHEGCRLKPYKDSEGIWTVGYGHTGRFITENTPAITAAQAEAWLVEDVNKAVEDAKAIVPNYDRLDFVRKTIVINMAFNLGRARLAGFKKMLAALGSGDYRLAALEMVHSKWASQVKSRATELAARMSSGKIPTHLLYVGDA